MLAALILCAPAARASAAESAANCAKLSDEGLISEGYLGEYGYGTEEEGGVYISSYAPNGGNYGGAGGNTADRAFDGDFSTFWETGRANGGGFINNFTVTFSGEARIDRIIYATRQDAQAGRGYPTVLTVYVSGSESGEDFEEICSISSSNGSSKVVFDLGGIFTCRRMRLEFTEIKSDLNYASAAEFIFLKPEEDAVRAVRSAFSDYTKLTFTQSFSADAENYIQSAKNTAAYAYSEEVKLLTDRAQDVFGGKVAFNPAFELSTADGAKNPIARNGDIVSYARNTLKMVWLGTNRQPTGIGAKAGERLTVFVDCEDGDPLPSIECTQFIGTWQGWRSGPIKLSRGINFITVPNYYGGWSNTVAGGPLYIVNPYTQAEQSANVKVYIEGGYSFPVYREGADEAEYLGALETYLSAAGENSDLPDMTEIVGDNVILTVTASQAAKQYVSGSYSPARALSNWKEYLSALYNFGGVYSDTHPDSRANYLNVNIRVMQPLSGAAAYAYGEHVGIYPNGDWELTCLRAENFGWGVTHELGHMMDISERTWSEYTNNMWSQYDKCALSGEAARGNFAAFLSSTVKDGVPYEERDAYSERTDAALTWWLIESRYPGFWGRFENNYRYSDRAGITDKAELHVYFASLAAGADLSYYFERIGFNWNGNDPFMGYDSASEQFKSAISAALSSGKIKNDPLKLWCLDAEAYNYTVKYGEKLAMYKGSEEVNFTVGKTAAGVSLLMDEVTDYRHLGYEILRGSESAGYKVIGFTYGRVFTDTSPAEGENYKVRAYDRALGCTALSGSQSTLGAVAMVGGERYQTLAEAISAAPAGGTVYLLSDSFAAGINIDKDITLLPESADVSVYLSASSAMFTVSSGASLTIEGADGHTVTLDGLGTSKNEALVVSAGTLTLGGGVAVQNSVNGSANGGALRISSGTLNLGKGSVIRDNSAANGGAIVSQAGANATLNIVGAEFYGNSVGSNGGAIYANCIVNVSDSSFTGNSAANGGAVCINGGGILSLAGCDFKNNSAASEGGALRLDGKTSFGGAVSSFSRNSAAKGGAIYAAGANPARTAGISNAQFSGNTATDGGALYIAGFVTLGAQGSRLELDGGTVGGSTAMYVAQNANLSQISGSLSLRGGVVLHAPLAFAADFSAGDSSVNAAFTANYSGVLARFASDATSMSLRAFAVTEDGVYVAELSADGDGYVLAAGNEAACTVTVTGGGADSAEYFIAGESFVLPDAEVKEGYIFSGWECGGRLYAAGEEVVVSSDMTFSAKYEAEQQGGGEQGGSGENGDNGGDGNNDDGEDGAGLPGWAYAAIGASAAVVIAVAITVGVYVHSKRKKRK
mgnify:FL=1